jgi:mRNA interferase RelE/StbE
MEILYTHKVGKELDKLPDKIARKVVAELVKLASDPLPTNSKKLAGQDNYRLRIGVYRVIYTLDTQHKEIIILRIAHRKIVYR